MPDPASWVQRLWDLLCEMYRAWGGDCADLGPAPADCVNTVTGEYAAQGAPTFPDEAAQDQFLKRLTSLENLLAEPGNTLGATDTNRLLALIASLRSDLGDGP